MGTRRALIAAAVLAVLGWATVPAVRAYALVAPSHGAAGAPPAGFAIVRFASADGTMLSGWITYPVPEGPIIVLAHGFRSSRSEMLPYAEWLREAGYGVLLFDLRGCGESGGPTIGLGATEPLDIRAAAGVARSAARTQRVAVLGVSLGAGAAIVATAEDPSITAVVADSAWPDQDFALDRLSRVRVGPLDVPLLPYGPALANALVGADVRAVRPLLSIARVAPRSVLLIHSADDSNATTPLAGARALRDAGGASTELWIAPRGGHAGAHDAQPQEYRRRVLTFLASALR